MAAEDTAGATDNKQCNNNPWRTAATVATDSHSPLLDLDSKWVGMTNRDMDKWAVMGSRRRILASSGIITCTAVEGEADGSNCHIIFLLSYGPFHTRVFSKVYRTSFFKVRVGDKVYKSVAMKRLK